MAGILFDRLEIEYKDWLFDKAGFRKKYKKLFNWLDSHYVADYIFFSNDENWNAKPTELRVDFFNERFKNSVDTRLGASKIFCKYLGDSTLLELFVSFGKRYWDDAARSLGDYGEDWSRYIWEIFGNLGLDKMDSSGFDDGFCDRKMHVIFERKCTKYGKKGPFPIEKIEVLGPEKDMRELNLGWQLAYYIRNKTM